MKSHGFELNKGRIFQDYIHLRLWFSAYRNLLVNVDSNKIPDIRESVFYPGNVSLDNGYSQKDSYLRILRST